MGYTKEKVIELLGKSIESDISTLYNPKKNKYINNKETDDGYLCYDEIAKYLLDPRNQFKKKFDSIPEKKRSLLYKQKTHNIRQKEKRLAHGLQETEFEDIGEIIDYEIPLKINKNDENVGEIDMLAYNNRKKQYSIIELKIQKNENDSLLHAILQIYTYYRQINKKKLFDEYEKPSDKDIQKVVFIFKDSRQYNELKSEYMRRLAKFLEVKIFVLEGKLLTF